jgi:hypothetical protein
MPRSSYEPPPKRVQASFSSKVVVFGQDRLETGCGEMVWASPTPSHEEAIAQARINHREGSAQTAWRAESSREDRGQGGDLSGRAGLDLGAQRRGLRRDGRDGGRDSVHQRRTPLHLSRGRPSLPVHDRRRVIIRRKRHSPEDPPFSNTQVLTPEELRALIYKLREEHREDFTRWYDTANFPDIEDCCEVGYLLRPYFL